MSKIEVELGGSRTDADGGKRYRPLEFSFDSRVNTLTVVVQDDWDPDIAQQWRQNQADIRMHLLAEHGTVDGESKINNFITMGPAPWSIVFEHNAMLRQVRSAFTHGDFYPALVGACALAERIFNELLLRLRDDYAEHKGTTKRIKNGSYFDDWRSSIQVLYGWGILDDDLRDKYLSLMKIRHESVHFKPDIAVAQRDAALNAILLLQDLVSAIFNPHGGAPRFIANTPGESFLTLAAENEPIIKRIFLPRSALVSPRHSLEFDRSGGNLGCRVYDDSDYPASAMTDDEFAAERENGKFSADTV